MIECTRLHEPLYISTHVEKLNFPNFNLRAKKTCPFKTKACESYCYADKGRFMQEHIQNRYDHNFLATQCSCFIEAMSYEINRFQTLTFRIHASGDFYSRAYFNKWVQIAKNNPRTVFYAYTRNYTLDLSDLPVNMIIYYSMDHTTLKINETAQRFATVIDVDKNSVEHLETYKDGKICHSNDCASCGYCFNEAGNIYFPQKYKKYQVELITI